MPYNLTNFENGVASRIQDTSNKLSTADRDAFITQAVQQRYSKDRPRVLVSDISADGTSDFALPTGPSTPPEQFEDGFSEIRTIEYPIGNVPETYVDNPDWKMYRSPSGLKIRLLVTVPNQGENIRVLWTLRHTPGTSGQNPVNTTIPDADFEAVCDLASALCAEALAATYAQTRDASISADAVNYRTKGQEYLALAKALRARYDAHVGIEEGSGTGASGGSTQAAAAAVGNLYEQMGSGVDRLTHRRPR